MIRRSASQSSRLITSSAQMPAWMNALTMVSPDLRIDTGPPIAFGSAASTASANLRRLSLSLGSPFGNASTRISPSLDFQLFTSSGGSVFSVTGPRLQRVLELIEHDLQRRDENVLRLVARRLVAAGQFRQRVGQPPRGDRARPLAVAGGSAQAVDRTLQRLDILLIGGRRIDRIRD